VTAPAKRVSTRLSVLPEPELVSLPEDGQEPSERDWWAQYGGRLDLASGVIAFPPRSLPPCPLPECSLCATRGRR
jgi:hypothetical protein